MASGRFALARFALPALLAAALAARFAEAQPFTAHFAAVRAKAEELRDALADPMTKTDAKRRALVDKILTALDAASDSLADDAATGKAVAASVVKGFATDPALPGALRDALAGLAGDLRGALAGFAARLDALPASKLTAKARKLATKADASLTAAEGAAAALDLKKAGAALAKAAAKAGALADATAAAELGGGPAACGGTLNSGLKLALRGAGYAENLAQSDAVDLIQGTQQTYGVYDQGPLTFEFELAPNRGDVHTGAVTALTISVEDFTGGFRGRWEAANAPVTVMEERADRVRLCFDATLTSAGPQQPATITVSGYVVFKR